MSPRRIARALAAFCVAALIVIVVITAWVMRRRSAERVTATTSAQSPGTLLHARNFHWTQMKGDKSQWVLKAKDASYSNDRTHVILRNAELSMTAQDGKQVLLQVPKANLTMSGDHISLAQLSGGLEVHYGNFVLTTRNAVFTPDGDKLDAPGAVKIEGQGLTVTGVGLEGHPRAEVFQLLNQVSMQIEPKRSGASSKVS